MTIAYTEWASPLIDNIDLDYQMSTFFMDFDNKMQAAGILRIDAETTEFRMPTKVAATPSGTMLEVCKYTYKLPKGNGKTEFEEVPGQSYKKIKRASFVNTDTEIQLKFSYLKFSATTNISVTDPRFFSKTYIVVCELLTRNTSNVSFRLCNLMGGYYYVNAPAEMRPGFYASNARNRTNYIILTEDSLSVFFGCIDNDKQLQGSVFAYQHSIVGFNLKRSRNSNSHSILTSDNGRQSSSTPLALFTFSCSSNYVRSIRHEHIWETFINVPNKDAVYNYNGESIISPTISIQGTSREINNTMYTTRFMPGEAVLVENNAVILYNDNIPVIASTLTLGTYTTLSVSPYRESSVTLSFMLIKPNHTIHVGDLT